MSDERLSKRTAPDPAREPRAMTDRAVTENRELTDDERLDAWRLQSMQEALPNLPEIPGYHVCWLTTTNPRDSIPMRMRLGYLPVTREDLPGWQFPSIKSGEMEHVIAVNEMVAYKIRRELYERYMRLVHHDMPMSEDEKLTAVLDGLKDRAQQRGARVIEGDGTADLRKRAPAPAPQTWS